MNPELVLFLEENGFVLFSDKSFRKESYHQVEKEIEINCYGLDYRHGDSPERFGIEVHVKKKNNSEDDYQFIIWIEVRSDDLINLKIKRIINNLDEIILISRKSYDYVEYFDYFVNSMTLSSEDNDIAIDLSEDEIKIIDNRMLNK